METIHSPSGFYLNSGYVLTPLIMRVLVLIGIAGSTETYDIMTDELNN